jgi:hypothetical protein
MALLSHPLEPLAQEALEVPFTERLGRTHNEFTQNAPEVDGKSTG